MYAPSESPSSYRPPRHACFEASALTRTWRRINAEAESVSVSRITEYSAQYNQQKRRTVYNRPCVETRAAKLVDHKDGTYSVFICINNRFLDRQPGIKYLENIDKETFSGQSRELAEAAFKSLVQGWYNAGFTDSIYGATSPKPLLKAQP